MELVTVQNLQLQKEVKSNVKEIYAFCSSVTPQFYKKKTNDELKVELQSIEMLISGINPVVLKKMCELAVKNYVKRKSEKPELIFDIHYINSFYTQAEYLTRNRLNSFDGFLDNIEDVEI